MKGVVFGVNVLAIIGVWALAIPVRAQPPKLFWFAKIDQSATGPELAHLEQIQREVKDLLPSEVSEMQAVARDQPSREMLVRQRRYTHFVEIEISALSGSYIVRATLFEPVVENGRYSEKTAFAHTVVLPAGDPQSQLRGLASGLGSLFVPVVNVTLSGSTGRTVFAGCVASVSQDAALQELSRFLTTNYGQGLRRRVSNAFAVIDVSDAAYDRCCTQSAPRGTFEHTITATIGNQGRTLEIIWQPLRLRPVFENLTLPTLRARSLRMFIDAVAKLANAQANSSVATVSATP